jgi:hypothetical protein
MLYVVFYSLIGFFFSRELARIGEGLTAAERSVTWIIAVGVTVYVVYRVHLAVKHRLYRKVPHITVRELKERMERDGESLFVCDARSHGYYEENAKRIPGSMRLEPASISEAVHSLPRDKVIYLYCT